MFAIFQALILGLVQGASEFLPISSSGHLILVPNLLNWHGVVDSLSFDVALHIGTTIAVIAFFWKDWVELTLAFLKALPKGWNGIMKDFKAKFFVILVIGSIPAAIVGFALQDFIENNVRSPQLVASLLIIFAFVLLIADRVGKRNRDQKKIGFVDSIVIGVAQCLALLPGVSRSGITITAGLFRDLDRETATRFSFLLSTPIIVGAGLLKLKSILHNSSVGGSQEVFLVGFIAAAISGWFAIRFLLKFVQSNKFTVFVIYRLIIGAAILLLVSLKG